MSGTLIHQTEEGSTLKNTIHGVRGSRGDELIGAIPQQEGMDKKTNTEFEFLNNLSINVWNPRGRDINGS